jgi:hypothetical protein
MKKALFVLCLLSTSTVFAQFIGGSRPSEVYIPQAPSHPAHAGYAPMSQELNILASASYSSAQGDRPAWDFPQAEALSLGVAARELKKQHDEQAKKSKVVWVN